MVLVVVFELTERIGKDMWRIAMERKQVVHVLFWEELQKVH